MSIKLFIADTDQSHIHNVKSAVSRCPDLRVIGSGGNGAHVLTQLSITPADVLLTEVQLPGLDGIQLTRDLQGFPNPPAVVVCTQFYSPMLVSQACASGAVSLFYKPLDYRRLPEILCECHRARRREAIEPKARDLPEAIRALLNELGMPAKLTGSAALTEALLAADADPALLKNLSKGLYAVVAQRMRSTPARLERALRGAAEIAWSRGGLSSCFDHCPTNLELLRYLLERLRRGTPPEGHSPDLRP